MSPRQAYEEAVEKALIRGVCYADEINIDMIRRRGEPLPDKYKPGALLASMPNDVLEALRG